jgi:hypothetical protein
VALLWGFTGAVVIISLPVYENWSTVRSVCRAFCCPWLPEEVKLTAVEPAKRSKLGVLTSA